MSLTVMRTEHIGKAVHYSVRHNGEIVWLKVVEFSPGCPPAGAAFVRAAQERERIAHEINALSETEPQYIAHAEAAAQIGVTKNTIYRWEKLKLIKPPLRDRNGHRLFTPELIQEIKAFKNAGIGEAQ